MQEGGKLCIHHVTVWWVLTVSFPFVLVFVHKYWSKNYKNVVELKGVEPKVSDTKRKGGIVNDSEKEIDSLGQAPLWHIEATNENMFKRNLIVQTRSDQTMVQI